MIKKTGVALLKQLLREGKLRDAQVAARDAIEAGIMSPFDYPLAPPTGKNAVKENPKDQGRRKGSET
jgi:hypothetical protein